VDWYNIAKRLTIVLEKSNQWGLPARAADSEYTAYFESQVKVYNGNQLISSTDNGVRALQQSLLQVITGRIAIS